MSKNKCTITFPALMALLVWGLVFFFLPDISSKLKGLNTVLFVSLGVVAIGGYVALLPICRSILQTLRKGGMEAIFFTFLLTISFLLGVLGKLLYCVITSFISISTLLSYLIIFSFISYSLWNVSWVKNRIMNWIGGKTGYRNCPNCEDSFYWKTESQLFFTKNKAFPICGECLENGGVLNAVKIRENLLSTGILQIMNRDPEKHAFDVFRAIENYKIGWTIMR